MDDWMTALGGTALIFQATALIAWLTLFRKINRGIWLVVFVGFVALSTHRINELLQWSTLFAQLTANIIAYTTMYAVLKAREIVYKSKAVGAVVKSLAEDNVGRQEKVASRLAARIVELKSENASLRRQLSLTDPAAAKTTMASDLAEHFIDTRNKLRDISDELDVYKSIADAAPIPMVVTDLEGQVTYANPAYLDLLKTEMPYLLGSGWAQFVENGPEILASWKEAVTRKDRVVDGIVTFKVEDQPVTCTYRMTRVADGYFGFIVLKQLDDVPN